eukprot:1192972-Prorocentrum_minimum.AAC.2
MWWNVAAEGGAGGCGVGLGAASVEDHHRDVHGAGELPHRLRAVEISAASGNGRNAKKTSPAATSAKGNGSSIAMLR